MPGKLPPTKLRPGDELTVGYINQILDWAVEGSIAHLGPGLMGSPTPSGWAIGLAAIGGSNGFLAKTNGVITARSGTTAGTGSVFLTTFTPSTIVVSTATLTVYNFSSTVGGIATATFVWVQQGTDGYYWITAVDCA